MKALSEIFINPSYLLLLLIIPMMATWYYFKHKQIKGEVLFSGFAGVSLSKTTLKHFFRHLQYVFRLLAITGIIIALARPQSTKHNKEVNIEGIDIMISIDISGSMLAEDLKPNRIEAAKQVAADFIGKRPNDRIGLIAYSGIAFTQCPLTPDHQVLIGLLEKIKNNMVQDGTAIGDGLGLAVERLRSSEAISKVVILLTDGINNMGFIDPMTAAELAKSFGIRVYTIGIGTYGKAPFPFRTPFGGVKYEMVDVEIDEPLLKNIAEMTGGKYFRATDNQTLQNIYNEIDQLEKTKIEVAHYTRIREMFHIPLLFAFMFLLFELLIKYLIVKSLP
jgi:Ca-activated chloride channel family protein